MTRVTVIKQSRYPLADRGLALVVGTQVTYRTAAGPVAAVVVAAKREPGAPRRYRLTLDVPPTAVPSRQDPPVCPVCGGRAERVKVKSGSEGLRCAGGCRA